MAGPGIISNSDQEYMDSVIRYVLDAKNMPDIFTSINFPYTNEVGYTDGFIYQRQLKKLANRNFLREQTEMIQAILADCGFRGEYWVTDWGNSLANRNYIQDSCFRAAFILENVLKNRGHIHAMGIFYASDLINVFSDSTAVLSGSAGLISRHGICKPAYYAFRYLGKLGRYCLLQTENCVITAESSSDFRILCYNDKTLGPKYYLAEENTYRPDELDRLFVSTDPLYMEIQLKMMEDEDIYVIRQKILNEEKGSILNKWIGFDCSLNLSRSDMEYLERVSTPEITAERAIPIDSRLRISFRMEPNEIRLITVTKE